MSKSEYEEVLLPICKEALKHRTHWQQQAREAVEAVRQYADDVDQGHPMQRSPLPYMPGDSRLPDVDDNPWRYLIIGKKLEHVFGLRHTFVSTDTDMEIVGLWRHLRESLWKCLHRVLRPHDFQVHWEILKGDLPKVAGSCEEYDLDPAVVEFEEYTSSDITDVMPGTASQEIIASQGISSALVEEILRAKEDRYAIEERLSHSHRDHIRRAYELFQKAPEHWYAHLDAVASLPKDPWHEEPNELKERYARRFGLSTRGVDSGDERWPGAWDFLGGNFRYPQDIHFAYAAVADALEAHGCIGIIPERIRKKKPQVWQGRAGRLTYDLGLLPQLLDWIEEDMRKIMAPGTENSLAQMEGSGVQPVREEPTDPSHKIKNKKTPSSRGEPSKLGDTGKRKGNLSPSRIIARQSFVWALCANRKLLDATQSDVYGWLSREEIRGEEENPYNGTKMPQSETWMRYLREACDTEALRDEIERHWLQADQEGQSVVYVKNIQFHSSQKAD